MPHGQKAANTMANEALSKLIGAVDLTSSRKWNYLSESDVGEHIVEIVNVFEYTPFDKSTAYVTEVRVLRSDTLQEGVTRHWFRDRPADKRKAKESYKFKDFCLMLSAAAQANGTTLQALDLDACAVPEEAYQEGIVSTLAGTRLGMKVTCKPTTNGGMFTNASFFTV